jgi:eukaryotic-like serine/threonine-protein kinase
MDARGFCLARDLRDTPIMVSPYAVTRLPNLGEPDLEPTDRLDMEARIGPVPATPGDIVCGKYRIECELGRGGMGVVYEALALATGENVAIKILVDQSATPEVRARFVIEAKVAACLVDPHVCRVLDVGIDGASRNPFIAMQRLYGSDLASVLARGGPLRAEDAADLALQALAGLAQAHAMGVVHRDVKLSNLFLAGTPDGGCLLKVLDFGVSKAPGFMETTGLTRSGVMIGSPAYMAPEQVRSARNVDARADIWSVGVILYELLTGSPPFGAGSVAGTFADILKSEPEPLYRKRPDLPEAFSRVIGVALQKDRDRRYRDVLAFGTDLAPLCPSGDMRLARIRAASTANPFRAGHRIPSLSRM